MRLQCLRLCILLALAFPLGVQGQSPTQAGSRTRIAVVVTDSSARIASVLGGALRQLGDVDVVRMDEDPHYVFNIVALCLPSCRDLVQYAISFRVYKPLRWGTVNAIAAVSLPRDLPRWRERVDSLQGVIEELLSPRKYEDTFRSGVAVYSRDAYERFLKDLVHEVDYLCLDRDRAWARTGTDSLSWRRTIEFTRSRSWIC